MDFLKNLLEPLVKSFGRLSWEEFKVLEELKVRKGLVGILRLRAAHYAVALRLRVLEYSKCKSSAAGGGIDYLPLLAAASLAVTTALPAQLLADTNTNKPLRHYPPSLD